MTITEDRLFKQYQKHFIPLKECCEGLTGVSYKRACEQVRAGMWPFPVTRLHPKNQKAPYIVDITDLAKYIDECFEDAREDFEKFNK